MAFEVLADRAALIDASGHRRLFKHRFLSPCSQDASLFLIHSVSLMLKLAQDKGGKAPVSGTAAEENRSRRGRIM